LYELALEVWTIEMHKGVKGLVVQVSGDGVSRGQLREGVLTGMLLFIPFHLSSIQQSLAVEPWLWSWLGTDAKVLLPEQWFECGHDLLGGKYDDKGFWCHTIKTGTFIWDPPPASASVAIEEL
jgi:hypothetical protein